LKNPLARTLLFSLLVFTLSSCGYNTKDWPKVSIPYEESDIYQINIKYSKDNNQNDFVVNDQEIISYIYLNASFPYKEEIENYNELKNYVIKFNIEFVKKGNDDKFSITFYSLGISNGYVDINNEELHFVPGDIESFYEKIEIKISKEGK